MEFTMDFSLSGLPSFELFEFDENFYSILDLKKVNKIKDGTDEMRNFIEAIPENFKYRKITNYKDVVKLGIGMDLEHQTSLDVVYLGLNNFDVEIIGDYPDIHGEILQFDGKFYMAISLFVDILYEAYLTELNYEDFKNTYLAEILESRILKRIESDILKKLFRIFKDFNKEKNESF